MIKKSYILVAVHSHISLFYHRYVFRQIFKIYADIQLLFFIGLDSNKTLNDLLINEMYEYRDIVLFNFYCDYYNLHRLTFYFLKWINIYKHLYQIIIKQDTDTFVNINLLKHIIKNNMKNNESFVLGKIWYINNNKKKYPSGMSYIFSSKSIDKLLINIDEEFSKLKYGYPEDMFFGLLARKANISFYDSYQSFKYITYQDIPKEDINIKKTLFIHTLRISEIAFLHFHSVNVIQKYIS